MPSINSRIHKWSLCSMHHSQSCFLFIDTAYESLPTHQSWRPRNINFHASEHPLRMSGIMPHQSILFECLAVSLIAKEGRRTGVNLLNVYIYTHIYTRIFVRASRALDSSCYAGGYGTCAVRFAQPYNFFSRLKGQGLAPTHSKG